MIYRLFGRMFLGSMLCLAMVSVLHADTLETDTIAIFPKNTTQLSYADLKEARQHPWFKPFEMQVVPDNFLRFEQFLESPQMGAATEVDTVVWALAPADAASQGGGDLVGAASGHFNTETARSFIESRQLPSLEVNGTTIYKSQTGWEAADVYFAFLDSRTVIFGPRNLVGRLIEVHDGTQDSLATNEPMMAMIGQVNGEGVFWSAMNGDGARQAALQVLPSTAKFPQAQELFGKVTALLITVDDSSDTAIDMRFHIIAGSPQQALVLSQIMEAGVLMRRYQAGDDNPSLAHALDGASVAVNGTQTTLSLELSNDQIIALMQSNTFAHPTI